MQLKRQYDCKINVYRNDKEYIVNIYLYETTKSGCKNLAEVEGRAKSQRLAGMNALIQLIETINKHRH